MVLYFFSDLGARSRLYVYFRAITAFWYYSERYGFKEGDYIVGEKPTPKEGVPPWPYDNWQKWDNDLDRLRGHKSVWVLFSHVWNYSGLDEEQYFLNHLSSIGIRLDAMKQNGAAVYLYNLGKEPGDG